MNSPNKSATISVADFLFFTIFSNASYPELAFVGIWGGLWVGKIFATKYSCDSWNLWF